jgi:P-type conjugative transfer protein TrbL
MITRVLHVLLAAMLVFGIGMGAAWAQDASTSAPSSLPTGAGVPDVNNFFDGITTQYVSESAKWIDGITRVANRLLGWLAIIGFALALLMKYLQQADNFASLPAVIVKQTMVISFFFWAVNNAPHVFDIITSYFQEVGQAATQTRPPTASTIAQIGTDCMFHILESVRKLSWAQLPTVGLVSLLVALALVLCFVAIAAIQMITIIEAAIIMAISPAMLAFGALSYTRDFATKSLMFGITVGVKLLVLHLVVAIGIHFAEQWSDLLTYTKVGANFFPNSFFILGGAAVLALLSWFVPKLASSIVSGSLNLGAGDLLGVAAAGGTAAAAGAALGGAAGAAAGSTLKGATQAVAAGQGLAAAQGMTGWRGLGAGLGHAVRAAGADAGQGMRAKVGLDKRSDHAVDRFGKDVGNLGTRAANRLDSRAQGVREAGAGTATPTAGTAPGFNDGGEPAGGASGGQQNRTAAPPAGNNSSPEGAPLGSQSGTDLSAASRTTPVSVADIKPLPLSSQQHVDAGAGQIQDAIRRVKPPQLPHDGGSIDAPGLSLHHDE